MVTSPVSVKILCIWNLRDEPWTLPSIGTTDAFIAYLFSETTIDLFQDKKPTELYIKVCYKRY